VKAKLELNSPQEGSKEAIWETERERGQSRGRDSHGWFVLINVEKA